MRIRPFPRMLFAGILAAVGAANQASAVPLGDLLWDPCRGILHGDMLFDNFSLDVTGVGTFITNPFAIDVYGVTLGDDYGVRFAGLMAALSNRTPSSWVTMLIRYDVTLLDPLLGIRGLSMSFNGVATTGDGSASVDEAVAKIPGGEVAVRAHVDTSNTPTSLNFDFYEFPADEPRPAKLHIDTTITLDSGKAGTATISFLNQTFASPLIPEPAAIGLFALALPILLRRSRRR